MANILGSKPGTIFTMLRDTGGIKPHERKRAVAHLTLSEREEIRAGLSAKMSIRAIATALNRSPSTISREVQRNRGRRYYKAVDANNRANRMAKRPKPCLLDQNLPLRKLVLEKLEMKWSPEQISGWLRRTKPRQKTLRISPETIYKTLYFRSREALHHLNIQHLRRSHSLRHGRRHTRKGERGTINIVNGTPIHERSRNIDNRRSLGHWEGDLVSGTKNSHIATLVDRKSRYTIILRLRGKDSVSVNQALTDKFLSLPSELRKSLTWDRGMELARHLEFTVSTGVKVYFCDPQSPWQRGTNENTNGLIRQYFPKKTCLAQYTQHELDLVATQLGLTYHPDAESLARTVDIVNLQVPLYPSTEHFFNQKMISEMKRGSYLINTARAQLVDRDAVVNALKSGHLAGYAGDVWFPQPAPASHPWRTMPWNGMTPHMSGTSLSAQARYAAGTLEILESFLGNSPIREEYLIVDRGQLAGTGAKSYQLN
ncbi:IS30 family transposase [Salmonella enterica subsp. enterica serovar Tennessee]|nr:IS30 family transposase [Salmonella enterica subsp. enterica serovar Tennessee]EFO0534035.1 IS30 family transposase [Escherichia coli]